MIGSQNTRSDQVANHGKITDRSAGDGIKPHRGYSCHPDGTKITKSAWQIETEYRLKQLEDENFMLSQYLMEFIELLGKLSKSNVSHGQRLYILEINTPRDTT